jgi:hypothetical protein
MQKLLNHRTQPYDSINHTKLFQKMNYTYIITKNRFLQIGWTLLPLARHRAVQRSNPSSLGRAVAIDDHLHLHLLPTLKSLEASTPCPIHPLAPPFSLAPSASAASLQDLQEAKKPSWNPRAQGLEPRNPRTTLFVEESENFSPWGTRGGGYLSGRPSELIREGVGQDGEASVYDGADDAVQLRAALRVRTAQGLLPQARRLVQGQERQGTRQRPAEFRIS